MGDRRRTAIRQPGERVTDLFCADMQEMSWVGGWRDEREGATLALREFR